MKRTVLFSNINTGEACYDMSDKASYKGVTIKTSIFLLITIAVAIFIGIALPSIVEYNASTFYGILVASSIVGFISVLIGRLNERASKYCGAIYSMCEGLFLGSITAICEAIFPGISILAVFSTLIIFAVMLLLFATGVIKAGNKLRTIVLAMMIGGLALILFTSLMGIFVPAIVENIAYCILFELFFLIYGAITLAFNFDEARMVVENGCSKNSEWSVALGLEVSLIYIYIEALRLLVLIFARRD